LPVFTIGELTFGILICNDSNYYEPAHIIAAKGAAALFIPTNNGLPPTKAAPELVAETRNVDVARAMENSVAVIRADVAGQAEGLLSYGTSAIVDRDGNVLQTARQMQSDLIVADIKPIARKHRRGWDTARNSAVMREYLRLRTDGATEIEDSSVTHGKFT
jgi:predicted amidohydrolase